MLPWLVLLGRCCLHWEHQLGVSRAHTTIEMRPLGEINDLLVRELESAAVDAKVWLSAGSNAAQLEAAGYDVQKLRECIEGAEAALQDAVTGTVCGPTSKFTQQRQFRSQHAHPDPREPQPPPADPWPCPLQPGACARLQQPLVQQHVRPLRGKAGCRQQQQVLQLPHGQVVLQGLSEGALEAPQASVQGPG
jgi:hypothetical protein